MKKFYISKVFLAIFLIQSVKLLAINEPTSQNKTLSFQENKGQISNQFHQPRPDILFSGTDGNLVYHLKQNGISYQLSKVLSWQESETYPFPYSKRGSIKSGEDNKPQPNQLSIYRIDINWLNCNTNANINKGETLEGYDNFYTDACPQGALEVKRYKDVTYKNLYPGIDLKWYEKNGQLKYDYEVSAGADYTQIKLEINGAEKISVNSKGQLILKTSLGELIEDAPIVIQDGKTLPSVWKISGNIISFQIERIDSQKPFTIDPLVRLWGTYYGGSGNDWVGTTYTDNNGNLFVSGGTSSGNLQTIATTGAFQTTYGGTTGAFGDAYLVKFNSSGQRQWGTYLGGSGIDFAYACVVDGNGDVYITGGTTTTNSAIMTTSGCHQSVFSATNSGIAYLAKFNTSGARIWSTYYGENAQGVGIGVTCDALNNVYVAGSSNSVTATTTLIASSGAHQTTFGGGSLDGFLVKFNSSGVRQWGTYYGGNGDDQAFSCITDASGNVYTGGVSSSTNAISTSGSHQVNYGGGGGGILYGIGDAFVVKFNSSGVRLWGTYYGGAGDEGIYYSGIDALGNIYFSGSTSTSTGTAIASPGAHQSVYGGGLDDAMFVKFDPAGVRQWGTYYGGANLEEWTCCFIDKANSAIYFSGITGSGGTNIATPCAYQNTIGGSKDAFLCKFNLQGTRLWGTYYGGTGIEDWSALTVDGSGAVYLCGETNSSSSANASIITSSGAHQTIFGGGTYDAFITKFNGCIPTAPPALTNTLICKGQPAILSTSQQCGINWFSDVTLTNLISSNAVFTTNPLTSDTIFYLVDISCGIPSIKTTAHVTLTAGPSINISANPSSVCIGEKVTLTPNGAINYTWTNSSNPYTIVVIPTAVTVYTVSGSLFNGGCATKTNITISVNECLGLNETDLLQNFNLKIFPNPSNGSITLSGNKSSQIIISNELGQIIKTIELSEANLFKMELNDMPSGIYFVRTELDAVNRTEKIIVLR